VRQLCVVSKLAEREPGAPGTAWPAVFFDLASFELHKKDWVSIDVEQYVIGHVD